MKLLLGTFLPFLLICSYIQAEEEMEAAQQVDTLKAPAQRFLINLVGHGVWFDPVGEFEDNVSPTLGLSAGVRALQNKKDALGAYLGFGLTNYASASAETFLDLELEVTTRMVFLEVGPQFHIRRGPVIPYIHAGAGISIFETIATVSFSNEEINSEELASDINPTFSVGAGCKIYLHQGLYLDANVAYRHNGTMSFLLDEGEVTSEANVFCFMVGLSFDGFSDQVNDSE